MTRRRKRSNRAEKLGKRRRRTVLTVQFYADGPSAPKRPCAGSGQETGDTAALRGRPALRLPPRVNAGRRGLFPFPTEPALLRQFRSLRRTIVGDHRIGSRLLQRAAEHPPDPCRLVCSPAPRVFKGTLDSNPGPLLPQCPASPNNSNADCR
jgi:hypothetical protein